MDESYELELLPDVKNYIRKSWFNEEVLQVLGPQECETRFFKLLHDLTTPPSFTTLRLNTRIETAENIIAQLKEQLEKEGVRKHQSIPAVQIHPICSDAVVILNSGPHTIEKLSKEVIVDSACGMAVLRGADVFAQGIMAAPAAMEEGDLVSVYCDIEGKCRKGLVTVYEGKKILVGNGVAKMSRKYIYCSEEPPRGLAIEMIYPVYQAPSLSDLLPALIFPQNLPSIICCHVLEPQPGETILDMCAAPGGKTTHIATLMENKGTLIALDKSKPKLRRIEENASRWCLTCIQVYGYDATRAVDQAADPAGPPPYPSATFDRILLDVPCSALGQRPAIRNTLKLKEVSSYPPLQRKLFAKAVELLKNGGTLVYSTCTIVREENEEQVRWALETFPCIQLVPQTPYIGSPGVPCEGLTVTQLSMLQRFGPGLVSKETNDNPDTDTLGFFCAKFVKIQR